MGSPVIITPDAPAQQGAVTITPDAPPQGAMPTLTPDQIAYRKATASGPLAPPGAAEAAMTQQVGGEAGAAKQAGKGMLRVGGEAALALAGPETLGAVGKLMPGPIKEGAGKLFASVAEDANKIPVNLENSHDAAVKLMNWQRVTQMGPTVNKFLNRITSGTKGPLTYEEARDFYQVFSKMSADEMSKLPGAAKFSIQQLTAGLREDIGNAAGQVGRAADYYKAMGDYAHAARLQDWLDIAKKYLVRGALAAAGGGAVGAGAHFVKEGLEQ